MISTKESVQTPVFITFVAFMTNPTAKSGIKDLKGLKSQNLRDHMSEAELIFTALAELSTRAIAETDEAKGVKENAVAGKKGGNVAKNARKELESKTGKSVVTGENFLPSKRQDKKLK